MLTLDQNYRRAWNRIWNDQGLIRSTQSQGVRPGWVVDPEQRIIHVCEDTDHIHVVMKAGIVDGGIVLPGFQLPLDRLFGPIVPANASE
jgi:hypothetical protein